MTQIALIAALTKERVIGVSGRLPWHLPNDLKHFKAVTLGHPVIMGRRTYESIGRLLPGRKNIILTQNLNFKVAGAICVSGIEAALKEVSPDPKAFVIGGAPVFANFLPKATELYLTWVEARIQGDTYFPEIDFTNWQEVEREAHQPDAQHAYAYTFTYWTRVLK